MLVHTEGSALQILPSEIARAREDASRKGRVLIEVLEERDTELKQQLDAGCRGA